MTAEAGRGGQEAILAALAERARTEAGARAVGEAVAVLWLVVRRLLGPDGCPWDRAQDARSLRSYLIEECHELLEALDLGDATAVLEELGDLLYQVVFHAALLEDEGCGGLAELARRAAEKLVRRHPHVFGEGEAQDAAQAGRAWQRLKLAERRARGGGQDGSVLDGLARALPALVRADRIQRRVAQLGFDWPELAGVVAKLREECGELEHELRAGGDRRRLEHEIGDVLFTVVNVARTLGISAEDALREANARFERRFRRLEGLARERAIVLEEAGLEQLEALWQEAKRLEATGGREGEG